MNRQISRQMKGELDVSVGKEDKAKIPVFRK